MRRDADTTAADLDRPDGNGLKENYKKHDVGHQETVERLRKIGCEIVEWGIDMRHDDGDDGIIYDDKMDFKVFHNGELVALLDVKTKGSPKYMGRFNERHYVKYFGHAEEHDVPVFVAMYQVHYQREQVYDSFVFEVGTGEMHERVISSTDSVAVNRFPDGNDAVLIPHSERRRWGYLEQRIESQKIKNKHEN
jgi:hypothetical protein